MSLVDVTEIWSSLRAQIDAHRPDVRPDGGTRSTHAVPVALLTGFLGAGKSTLLAHLLQNPQGLRIRALVNDVGSLPFDPTLVELGDAVRVELTNGCGCCASSSDLAGSLDALAHGGDCDLIILEASGAADPTVLAHVVLANGALRLDRVVTVVNGAALLPGATSGVFGGVLERQMAVADCIVVSGCDKMPESDVERAVEEAARLAPGRTVTRSGFGFPASRVLMPGSVRGARLPADQSGGGHHQMHVTTVEQTCEIPLSALVPALEQARPGLVRAKGRLVVDGRRVHVQVTPHSIDVADADEGPTAITLISLDQSDVENLVGLISPS